MSPRPTKPVHLIDKIAAAFRAVDKLQRRGRNQTRRYPYTYASDVLEGVRDKLLRQGILIHATEGKPEYTRNVATTNGGESITECNLQVTYTFIDATTKLEPMTFNGVGRDVEDKSLYKAATGAQKSLLKRFGLMAETTDDPEWDDQDPGESGETLDDIAPPRVRRKERPLTAYQITAIREGVANTGKTEEQLSQTVAAIGHAPELAKVQQKHFKELFRWASDGKGTVATPKTQAVPAQESLPLRAATQPIQMKIGNKTVEFEPREKAYSV